MIADFFSVPKMTFCFFVLFWFFCVISTVLCFHCRHCYPSPFVRAYQPCVYPISNKQESAVFMLGTRSSRFSRHVWQFVGTCIELELCFNGPKSTLPSLRHRALFQGKVYHYPEVEDSDYRQQKQQVSKFCINWTSRVKHRTGLSSKCHTTWVPQSRWSLFFIHLNQA